MTPPLEPHESQAPAASAADSKTPLVGRSVPGNAWNLLDGVEPAEPPRVSVVLVHYDQQRELTRTLHALARQTLPAHEVIVVDDGSPSAPHVPPGVRLIVLPDRGFRAAAARNAGAAAASGDVLCFLDADTAPEPEYLARLSRLPALCPEAVTVGRRRHAAFGDADVDPEPDADSAGGHGTEADSATHPRLAMEPVERAGPRSELPEPAWLREAYAASHDLLDADHHSYRFLIGAVLCCSRAFFTETGGFDERFDRYGGEDWEWAHRAWTEGAVFAHVPEAVAWHDGPDLAGRSRDRDDLLRRKNAEALVLFDRIGLRGPGSATRGLRSAALEVVVLLPRGGVAATFVCADVLLEALPDARLLIDDDLAAALPADERIVPRSRGDDLLATARVTISVDTLFTVPRPHRDTFGETLRSAVEQIGDGTLGWVELTPEPETGDRAAPAARTPASESGSAPAPVPVPVLRLGARRAERRRERHPADHGFRTEHRPAPIRVLGTDPDLEAHLAGWAP